MAELHDWTRDHNGEPVNWMDPQFQKPNGVFSLVLQGEKYHLLEPAERQRRVCEYMRQVRSGRYCI